MKVIVRILNVVVAIGCILIIAGMIWFLYLTFVQKYGGYNAVTYILDRIWEGWRSFWGWIGGLLP